MDNAQTPLREATVSRDTLETQITVSVCLDGSGKAEFDTGLPFLEHMLDQIARHGMVDLNIKANGDLHIDAHHTVEDIGITLGQALAKAVGDRRGILRYGHPTFLLMRHCLGLLSIFQVVPAFTTIFLLPEPRWVILMSIYSQSFSTDWSITHT